MLYTNTLSNKLQFSLFDPIKKLKYNQVNIKINEREKTFANQNLFHPNDFQLIIIYFQSKIKDF